MKKMILLLISSCFIAPAFAQDLSGTWHGLLKVSGTSFNLVFHIKDSAGVYSATMDSPDQGTIGIPVSEISFADSTLHLEIGGGAIVYEGLLQGDSIAGTFHQSGLSLPLILHRGGAGRAAVNERPQEPKPPYPYKSEDVWFVNQKADGIKLAGTLTLPEGTGPFPAVVLISGSGAQDRDETLMGHKPFLVIADYLTRHGVAVLRFDDRGTAQSEGDFQTATTADFATDAEAAVALLRGREDISTKKIGLAGHSEGATVAAMVAAQDTGIGFLALLAGPGVPGRDILMSQTRALAVASGMAEDEMNTAAKANEQVYSLLVEEKDTAVLREKLVEKLNSLMPATLSETARTQAVQGQVATLLSPWFRFFLTADPAVYLKKVRCPVLAINGSKDVQVSPEQNINAIRAAVVAGGSDKITTWIFPGLNHLFQTADTGLPGEYSRIKETFSPEALAFLAGWILGVTQ